MRPPTVHQFVPHGPAREAVDLTGKRVLVTGASSGIGEAAAERFAHEGATVIAIARREDLLRALVERITAAAGHASAIACDPSDFDEVNQLIQTVEDRYGGIDVLVNNARCIRRPLQESLERWHDVERMIQLNYYALLPREGRAIGG